MVDYQGYYYGLSKGMLSNKLPSQYYIDYGTFDKKNPSVSIMETDMNLFLISKGKNIKLNEKEIKILKLQGDYFDTKDIIAKIIDDKGAIYNLKILYPKYTFIHCKNFDRSKYQYIDLDFSEDYYTYYNYIEFILLVILILFMLERIYHLINYISDYIL